MSGLNARLKTVELRAGRAGLGCPECAGWPPAGLLVVDGEPGALREVSTVTHQCGRCGRRVVYRQIARQLWEAL